jgi:hypothetical protein
MKIFTLRIWIGRALIGLVLLVNAQSALVFFFNPARFAPAYELIGVPGQAAIRGMAVLFLMWNVPYVIALVNPLKYRVSLYEAIAMQSIGLIGESLIFGSLPIEHVVLRGSILRFILFDGSGLVALIAAAWATKNKSQ